MPRPIQEIGVGEGDMSGPGCHQLADVLEDDFLWDDEKAPLVDGRDGAVSAKMQASAAGHDAADQSKMTVLLQMGVSLEGGQPLAQRHWKCEPLQHRRCEGGQLSDSSNGQPV